MLDMLLACVVHVLQIYNQLIIQMSHARLNIGSITSHVTQSSLKASEFRNYQRSLFKAKNFHARLHGSVLFYGFGDPRGARL